MGLRTRIAGLERRVSRSLQSIAEQDPRLEDPEYAEACRRTQMEMQEDAQTIREMTHATAGLAADLWTKLGRPDKAAAVRQDEYASLDLAEAMRAWGMQVETPRALERDTASDPEGD